MNRESTFSLTVMVIIMAILAIFIGYLLGNWLIQLVTEDTSKPGQVVHKEIEDEEVSQDEGNEQIITGSGSQPGVEENGDNRGLTSSEENIKDQLEGDVFFVQVGAFKNYNNARSLKEKLEAEGFQVFITENEPHKVRVGATTARDEIEKTEEKLKELGYDTFITH